MFDYILRPKINQNPKILYLYFKQINSIFRDSRYLIFLLRLHNKNQLAENRKEQTLGHLFELSKYNLQSHLRRQILLTILRWKHYRFSCWITLPEKGYWNPQENSRDYLSFYWRRIRKWDFYLSFDPKCSNVQSFAWNVLFWKPGAHKAISLDIWTTFWLA